MSGMRSSFTRLLGLAGLAALALALVATSHAQTPAAPAQKTLRYAFEIAETGMDPAKVSDLYSRTLTAHIFEGLYHYDPLARPVKVRPNTAAAMPEHSADYRVWTLKLKPDEAAKNNAKYIKDMKDWTDDEKKGLVKFKSDVTFSAGSAIVNAKEPRLVVRPTRAGSKPLDCNRTGTNPYRAPMARPLET